MLKSKIKKWPEIAQRGMEKIGGFQFYMLALLSIMFVAYDSQIWRLGFYYDEWEGVFLNKSHFSLLQSWDYFLVDRPFSAVLHFVLNPVFGSSTIAWHIFGLFINWAAIIFFVRAMLEIWPDQIAAIGWIGLLLGIYPGITRQFVLLTSIPHYSSMFLFMLSLWLMVLAFKHQRHRPWLMFVSILLGFLQVLLVEFFAGLELLRFFLLFFLIWRQDGSWVTTLKKSILNWLPYATIFGFFLVYKFYILSIIQMVGTAPKHNLHFIQQFFGDPFNTLIYYANMILQDVVHGIFIVWTLPIIPTDIELQSRAYVASWIIAVMMGILAFIAMSAWQKKHKTDSNPIKIPAAIWGLCIAAIFLGGLPGWITGKQAVRGIWSSRFLFGQVFGVVPLVVIFFLWLVGSNRRKLQHFLLAVLLVGAVSLQFRTGNDYAADWDYQRNFYWQLKWRIPGLTPKAFLYSPSSVTSLTVDYQMAYAVNVIYNSGLGQTNRPTWWFNGPEELRSVRESQPNSQREVGRTFRSIEFSSNMNKAVPVIANLSRGCLLVADQVYKDAPLMTESEKRMFLTTHPEMITQTESSPMPVDVFGSEPAHTWCYYFLKADLARQYQQWDQVLSLWTRAIENNFQPKYGAEYLPFIEAFALHGNWKQAQKLTEQATALTVEISPFLCGNWQRLITKTGSSTAKDVAWLKLKNQLACSN